MVTTTSIAFSVFLAVLFNISNVQSHALARVRVRNEDSDLRIEPTEAVVYAGVNVTFTCYYPTNVTFLWSFPSKIQAYEIVHGKSISNGSKEPLFFSRITVFSVSRFMSGELECSVEKGKPKNVGLLIVQGVRNGGECHNSSDCITDKAVCRNGICDCPPSYVRLRLAGSGYDVCREMIYSLYDTCEFDEQCSHLVDPKSVCNSVCVCAPYARDRKGRCVSLNEISYNRSQEMYRVGLIAVTCIIILIVAMSLWVTLKKSCYEQSSNSQRGSTTQTDLTYTESVNIDPSADKPPSYDDILGDGGPSPPNIKEALKNCMTAKRLLRQVSAPAGELLPPTEVPNTKSNCVSKPLNEV